MLKSKAAVWLRDFVVPEKKPPTENDNGKPPRGWLPVLSLYPAGYFERIETFC